MPKQLIKLATILTLILLSTSLHAQIDSDKADKGVNINFFNGYAISYKWNTTQNLNYRVYLGLNSSLTNSENNSESIYNDNLSNTRERTQDNKFLVMDLSFQFIYKVFKQKSYNMYLGIGPNLNYSYSENENTSERTNTNSTGSSEDSFTNNSYGIGIISLLGIEAHLTDKITLFAETHLSAKRSWTTSSNSYLSYYSGDTSTNSSKSSGTGSSWNANLQLVKVGLGIYF